MLRSDRAISFRPARSAPALQATFPLFLRLRMSSPDAQFATKDIAKPENIAIPTRHGEIQALLYKPTAADIAATRAAGQCPPVHFITHGGAFIVRVPEQEDNVARYLASELRAYVVIPDFDTAPTVGHPVSEQQAYDAFVWVHENGDRYGWDGERTARTPQPIHATWSLVLSAFAIACRQRSAHRSSECRLARAATAGSGIARVLRVRPGNTAVSCGDSLLCRLPRAYDQRTLRRRSGWPVPSNPSQSGWIVCVRNGANGRNARLNAHACARTSRAAPNGRCTGREESAAGRPTVSSEYVLFVVPALLQLVPAPRVHADLATAPALAATHQEGAAALIEIGLGERECFLDTQPGAPQDHDQCAQPAAVCVVAGGSHDGIRASLDRRAPGCRFGEEAARTHAQARVSRLPQSGAAPGSAHSVGATLPSSR
jgi:hypothetical protein